MYEQKLAELKLQLPAPPAPNGAYTPAVIHNGLIYIAGQLSRDAGNIVVQGRAGETADLAAAQAAAELCALRALSCLRGALGSLDRVERILKVNGYVHAAPAFQAHAAVLDAASNLLIAVFGEQGRHVRTSVGVASLPGGGLVEIDVVAAVRA